MWLKTSSSNNTNFNVLIDRLKINFKKDLKRIAHIICMYSHDVFKTYRVLID